MRSILDITGRDLGNSISDGLRRVKGWGANAAQTVSDKLAGRGAQAPLEMEQPSQTSRNAPVQPPRQGLSQAEIARKSAFTDNIGQHADAFNQRAARGAPVQPPQFGATGPTSPIGTNSPIRSPLDPRFADPLADSNAKIRTMNNPVLDQDAVQRRIGQANDAVDRGSIRQTRTGVGNTNSLEEQLGRAGINPNKPAGSVRTASPAEVAAKKGGFLRTAGTVAKGAGIAGTGLAVADAAAKAAAGETPEQVAGMRGAHGVVQGGGTELYDTLTLGQGRKFAHGVKGALGAIGGNPETYNKETGGFDPAPRTAKAGVLGFLGDVGRRFGKGWEEGRALETAAEGAPIDGPRDARVVPGQQDVDFGMTGNEGVRSAPVVPTDQGDQTAAQLMAGNAVPAEGTGAFQRTTPGNRGTPQLVDSREALRQDAVKVPKTLAELTGDQARAMGNTAAMLNRQATEKSNAELGIKQQTADTAASAAGLAAKKQRLEEINSRIDDEVGRDPAVRAIKDKDERAAAIAGNKADTSARAAYSLGRRNAGKGDASPRAVNDFFDSEKFRKKIVEARGGMKQSFADLFGDKRFDDDDSFSYRPSYKKGSRLYSENGNSLGTTDAIGGGFNPFGPNAPIDAGMKRYIDNLPTEEEYKAKKGGK